MRAGQLGRSFFTAKMAVLRDFSHKRDGHPVAGGGLEGDFVRKKLRGRLAEGEEEKEPTP